MRRLVLTYDIANLSTFYEEKTVPWANAEFTAVKNFTGTLRLWEDGVEPEQVWEAKKRLEERAEAFGVAMRYQHNHGISLKLRKWPTYHFTGQEYPLRSEREFAEFMDYMRGKQSAGIRIYCEMPMPEVHMTISSAPAPLPESMPSIPPDIHWMAETLVAADRLSEHPDLVMKLAFLVLDLDDFKKVIRRSERGKDEYKWFSFVRDFVSHPICHRKKEMVKDIGNALPSSRTRYNNGTEAVQFRRNDKNHIAFVAKHARYALQRAKELFSDMVKAEGGFLRD